MTGQRRPHLVALVALIVLGLTACGSSSGAAGGSAAPSSASVGDPSTDKLAQVKARGTLVLSTDLGYAPQSYEVKGSKRNADTKCAANQLTGNQMTGYDAETGKAVALKLGVEPCFVTPSWTEVTAGAWSDRWDVAWGSGAITADRMTRLYVTQPSYSTPNVVFVAASSPITTLSDLDGKTVGACTGCTMEQYLRGTLVLPGVTTTLAFKPKIATYDNEVPGLKAVAAGDLDAFLCSEPVGQGQIKAGLKLRELSPEAYQTYKTGYVDHASGLSSTAFVAAIDKAMAELHADGTMASLSKKFFGVDYAAAAAKFDMSALGQKVS